MIGMSVICFLAGLFFGTSFGFFACVLLSVMRDGEE